jgi:hypothetical protein
MSRRARDPDLLDALDARPRSVFEGIVWRVARTGGDPLEPSYGNGRWDLQAFDVLYASLEGDGAIAEINYHLGLQPVFPSRLESTLHQIVVRASSVMRFDSLSDLEPFGVNIAHYSDPLYERTREIGDAVAFLGCDALIAPSARWDCLTLVCITDNLSEPLTVRAAIEVDWSRWRASHPIRYRAT